jgi:hypothetical protein
VSFESEIRWKTRNILICDVERIRPISAGRQSTSYLSKKVAEVK